MNSDELKVSVAFPKGASSVGMASFASKISSGELDVPYIMAVAGTFDQVSQAIIDERVDIAILPPSSAAMLYNQQKGKIKVVCVNALGGAGVVTGSKKVKSIEDLAGKTVYVNDQSDSFVTVFKKILDLNGLTDEVTLEYDPNSAELAAKLKADKKVVAVLPQPEAAAAVAQDDRLRQAFDVSSLWDEKMVDGSRWVTGVVVVRNKFFKRHPEVVEDFLAQLEESTEIAAKDPITAIPLVTQAGILSEAMATEGSLPACHPVCIRGAEMRKAVSGYLQVLYDENPASVGGLLPDGNFYYVPVEQVEESAEE
ncbi:MAG: ABC transporter substrate-binding protein [Atopobiaceae bacterium]|nr:ABC transporter substrate-binding protein [Atopobiaceae bacterium]